MFYLAEHVRFSGSASEEAALDTFPRSTGLAVKARDVSATKEATTFQPTQLYKYGLAVVLQLCKSFLNQRKSCIDLCGLKLVTLNSWPENVTISALVTNTSISEKVLPTPIKLFFISL